MNSLGQMYFHGWVNMASMPDHSKAFELFERSAHLGHSGSMQMIGMYYETGRGVVTKDVNKAKEWYVKAIAQGSKKAQAKLDALNANPAQDYRWVLRNNYQTMHYNNIITLKFNKIFK